MNELRNSLKNEALEELKSVRSFIILINSGKRASKAEITKALDHKVNKNILKVLISLIVLINNVLYF